MRKFSEFDLKKEILEALDEMNFIETTEVQEKAIPLAMEGLDIVVQSKTGTGKTAAFLIPILEGIRPEDGLSSLIVLPTRELALQVYHVAKKMTSRSSIRATVVYGGASIETQIRNLRRHPHIIVGTPGRLLDLMRRGEIDISRIKYLVLDEADIMLDLGFIEDIEYILSLTPPEKQTMLLSATVPDPIIELSREFMKHPKSLRIGAEKEMTVSTISHCYAMATQPSKVPTLLAYIKEYNPAKSIIFSETKRNADFLYNVLIGQGYNATVIHGDLTQAQREKSLSEFRNGAQFLVATNVAARGLDITNVSDVINFDTPNEPNVYVHRVGRSARMGKLGSAFTIIREDDLDEIRRIEKEVKINMLRIELNQDAFKGIRFSHSSGNRRNGGGRSHQPEHVRSRQGPGHRGHSQGRQRRY